MRIFFPILLIIGGLVLFFIVIDPLYTNIKELKTDIGIYNVSLKNARALQETRDILLEKYRNIKREDKEKLNNLLPSNINNIKFVLEIEQIANIYSLPLKTIKFDERQLQEEGQEKNNSTTTGMIISGENKKDFLPYGIFPMEFVVEGTYESFLLFLKELEINLRVMDIKSISFVVPEPVVRSQEGSDPNIYNYTLKVETYWLK
jgi:hypothetical protein